MSNLVHGLDQFHIAVLTKDTKELVQYEAPQSLIGAVDVSVTPNVDSNTKYADNGAFAVLNNLSDIDVSMTVVDLPQEIQTLIFGQKQEGEVVFSGVDDEAVELALGFRAKIQGGGSRFYWLLKGKPELLPINHQTDEGNVESQDAQLNIKFMPLQHNGNWKAQLDSKTVTANKWFADVVYDAATAKALTETQPEG
ncbi:major tail protein [Virgibacillus soli]|nr:major tail protein [Virgibacillus soli]